MSVKCRDCGVTKRTAVDARRQNWCRHTFRQQRTVQWSCPLCQQEQTKRALERDPKRKRFNLHMGRARAT